MSGWKIPKAALEASLNVLFAVPARSGIDTSEYVKIEKRNDSTARLSLSSDMSGCASLAAEKGCPLKNPIYIDRRMLQPFVAEGKDLSPEHYVLQAHDGYIILRHGHREGKYTSNKKATGYLTAPKISSKSHELSDEIASVLTCARQVAVDDPVAPHLSCVFAYPSDDRLKIMSANSHVFFLGSLKKDKHFHLNKAALPLPLIDAAKTENNANLLYSDKVAMLEFSCGVLWHPVKTEARKKFPYKRVESMIKKGLAGETILQIDANALFDSANRAYSYTSAVSADDPALKIETKKGDSEVRVRCNATGADFSEKIKLGKASKGDVSIEWPLSAILPILDYCRKSGVARVSRDAEGRTCFSAGHIAMLIGRREKPKSKKKVKKKEKK